MQRRRRPPAEVAVEQCMLCLSQLRGGRPHQAAEPTAESQPAHFDTMRRHLDTVCGTMQRAVKQDVAVAEELVAALGLLDLVFIETCQISGLGEHPLLLTRDVLDLDFVQDCRTSGLGGYPLLPTFQFELLLIRVAIQARLNNTNLNLLQDEDLRASAFPDMEAEDDWNRTRCARESVRMLIPRVEALRNGLPLLELVAEVEQPGTSINGTLIAQTLRVLTEAERTMSCGLGADFDLAARLVRRVHVILRQFSALDPLLDTSSLIGAVDTCVETITEAKADPDGPRVY